jgi:hypothetical protein
MKAIFTLFTALEKVLFYIQNFSSFGINVEKNESKVLEQKLIIIFSVVQPIRHVPRVANGHLNVANGFVYKNLKIRLFWTKQSKLSA